MAMVDSANDVFLVSLLVAWGPDRAKRAPSWALFRGEGRGAAGDSQPGDPRIAVHLPSLQWSLSVPWSG